MLKHQVEIDLVNDWVVSTKEKLKLQGYKIPQGMEPHQFGIYFFNLLYRKVENKPREVLVSKEFSCPPVYKKRLKAIKKILEKGDNIRPYLSTRLKKFKFDDLLFNDWGIHHIHLGKKTEDKEFAKRTDELLFVRFDEQHVYFIDVMNHEDFENEKILEIIHNNWPETIKYWRLDGVMSISPIPTKEQRKSLRDHGIVSSVQLKDGTVYGPVGGGYSTTKSSTKATTNQMHLFNYLKQTEDNIKKNYVALFKENRLELPDKLKFQLENTDYGLFVKEINSNLTFPLNV